MGAEQKKVANITDCVEVKIPDLAEKLLLATCQGEESKNEKVLEECCALYKNAFYYIDARQTDVQSIELISENIDDAKSAYKQARRIIGPLIEATKGAAKVPGSQLQILVKTLHDVALEFLTPVCQRYDRALLAATFRDSSVIKTEQFFIELRELCQRLIEAENAKERPRLDIVQPLAAIVQNVTYYPDATSKSDVNALIKSVLAKAQAASVSPVPAAVGRTEVAVAAAPSAKKVEHEHKDSHSTSGVVSPLTKKPSTKEAERKTKGTDKSVTDCQVTIAEVGAEAIQAASKAWLDFCLKNPHASVDVTLAQTAFCKAVLGRENFIDAEAIKPIAVNKENVGIALKAHAAVINSLLPLVEEILARKSYTPEQCVALANAFKFVVSAILLPISKQYPLGMVQSQDKEGAAATVYFIYNILKLTCFELACRGKSAEAAARSVIASPAIYFGSAETYDLDLSRHLAELRALVKAGHDIPPPPITFAEIVATLAQLQAASSTAVSAAQKTEAAAVSPAEKRHSWQLAPAAGSPAGTIRVSGAFHSATQSVSEKITPGVVTFHFRSRSTAPKVVTNPVIAEPAAVASAAPTAAAPAAAPAVPAAG